MTTIKHNYFIHFFTPLSIKQPLNQSVLHTINTSTVVYIKTYNLLYDFNYVVFF